MHHFHPYTPVLTGQTLSSYTGSLDPPLRHNGFSKSLPPLFLYAGPKDAVVMNKGDFKRSLGTCCMLGCHGSF